VGYVPTNDMMRPPVADMTSHRKENPLGRPALITRRHVDQLEDYGDLLKEVMADGHVDRAEQRLLVLRFAPIESDGQLIHESASFIDRAMHGDGVRAPWFRQMAREHARLRLVVDNTEPDPPGAPAGMKKAA
jgi:hypothetical protein